MVGEVVHIEPTGSMQDGSVQVTLDAGGLVLLVGVAADRFTFGTASVGFASPDCSGPALLYTGQPIGETVLGLAGVARVDLMLDAASGELWVLEANTIPGMTETSLLPMAADAAGIGFDQLIAQVLALA